MHRRWLSRTLIAFAVPAVLASALAPAATAAATAQVPTIDQVAAIYPHLDGGTASESTGKVYGPGKKCKPGKAIKGASSRSASYSPDYSSGDPDVYVVDGDHPSVSVTAMRFPSTKAAVKYLHGYGKSTKDCGGGTGGGGGGGHQPDCDTSMKKIRFSLGDERWGYQMRSTCRISGQTSSSVLNMLFARQGRYVVYANAMSFDASAPSIPSSVKLTKKALAVVG
ncbi:hypothetical protein [Nocardioides mangrovi]|uniref:Sensor domain-containing protein n=1 Tax=Nocardioides mangrovi TaxID=2874580 RepID=A0ABS7UG02_9ACTN|nr:hypothetical protein [Nocardioides mangrovi]MBZ5739807.1 hypothetical protein [Nocardioides mangrovi]